MNKDISIKVCMGTGGIAAGGVEVMSTFEKAFAAAGLQATVEKNCSMHKVGCRGFCARDVLVDVIVDDNKSTYQYIKPDMVERIVNEHIVGGTPGGGLACIRRLSHVPRQAGEGRAVGLRRGGPRGHRFLYRPAADTRPRRRSSRP